MSNKIKNDISYTYKLKDVPKGLTSITLDKFPEFLELVPLFKHAEEKQENYIGLKF